MSQINVLLPFKEKFSNNMKSSVSITVEANFKEIIFKNKITVFGQMINNPMLKENFFDNSREVVFRSLSDLIHLIGKKPNFVRGKKIENVLDTIKERKFRKETLGGCVIKMVNHTVILTKEG